MAGAVQANWKVKDYSNEVSGSTFWLPEIAAGGGNFDTVTGDAVLDNWGDIRIATLLLTRGELQNVNLICQAYDYSKLPPSNPDAQRELAIVVTYQDDVTGTLHRCSIPCPVATLYQANTDEIDIVANVVFAAWRIVFEASCVSPAGNAITVVRAKMVGRRS